MTLAQKLASLIERFLALKEVSAMKAQFEPDVKRAKNDRADFTELVAAKVKEIGACQKAIDSDVECVGTLWC